MTTLPADVLTYIGSYCTVPRAVQDVMIDEKQEPAVHHTAFGSGDIYLYAKNSRCQFRHAIQDTPQLRALMKAAELRQKIPYPPLMLTCKRFCTIFTAQNKAIDQVIAEAVGALLKTGEEGEKTLLACIACGYYLESFYLYFSLHPEALVGLFPQMAGTYAGAVPPSFFEKLLKLGEKHNLYLLEAQYAGKTALDHLQPSGLTLAEDWISIERHTLHEAFSYQALKEKPFSKIALGLGLFLGGILFLGWYIRSVRASMAAVAN